MRLSYKPVTHLTENNDFIESLQKMPVDEQ